VKLFIQGSYANNTNVRTQSDVDIAVIQEEVFITDYRDSSSSYPQSSADYGIINAENTTPTFKDEVEKSLEPKFGNDVERKDKSIKVYGNTYRKDADVVPCKRYRDYKLDFRKDVNNYVGGVVIDPDSGGRIINYPEQHIINGKKKNNDTNLYYKKMVRISKKIRYLLCDEGYSAANNISSFGLESLLWNIPDSIFMKYTIYRFEFGEIVNYLHTNKNQIGSYKEANGIKNLCSSVADENNYKEFIDLLKEFIL